LIKKLSFVCGSLELTKRASHSHQKHWRLSSRNLGSAIKLAVENRGRGHKPNLSHLAHVFTVGIFIWQH